MENYLHILRSTELFSGIEDSGILKLFDCMKIVRHSYSKGDYLCRAGDKPDSIGLVLSGDIHLVCEDFWGNNFILTDIHEGEIFAEASALTGNNPLLYGALAQNDVDAVFLPSLKLRKSCSASCGCHTTLIDNLLIAVAKRTLIYEHKCEHLSRRTTREKLISYLSEQSAINKNASFCIPYNRQQLADYLSVDRSAMSAELGKMQDEGLLRFLRSNFELLKINE